MQFSPSCRLINLILALAIALAFGREASAALGGEPSIAAAKASRHASKVTVPSGAYTIQSAEIDGTNVREFIAPDGKVFAVSWRGVREPDLEPLFGDYYADFKNEAAKQKPTRARRAVVRTPKLEVIRAGHMRDKRGIASVPSLMPPGVKPEDLQ